MAFLKRFQLTALNCWNAQDPPTFVNEPASSRIDYFLMRIADTDMTAREVKHFPTAAVILLTGARHIPMICSIRKIPYASTRAAPQKQCTFQQRMQCRQAWAQNTEQWQNFHVSFGNRFTEFTNVFHPDDTLFDAIHEQLLPVFHTFFPSKRSNRQEPAPDQVPQCDIIHDKWLHRAQFLA